MNKKQIIENKIRRIVREILNEDDKWKIGGEYRTMQEKFKKKENVQYCFNY